MSPLLLCRSPIFIPAGIALALSAVKQTVVPASWEASESCFHGVS